MIPHATRTKAPDPRPSTVFDENGMKAILDRQISMSLAFTGVVNQVNAINQQLPALSRSVSGIWCLNSRLCALSWQLETFKLDIDDIPGILGQVDNLKLQFETVSAHMEDVLAMKEQLDEMRQKTTAQVKVNSTMLWQAQIGAINQKLQSSSVQSEEISAMEDGLDVLTARLDTIETLFYGRDGNCDNLTTASEFEKLRQQILQLGHMQLKILNHLDRQNNSPQKNRRKNNERRVSRPPASSQGPLRNSKSRKTRKNGTHSCTLCSISSKSANILVSHGIKSRRCAKSWLPPSFDRKGCSKTYRRFAGVGQHCIHADQTSKCSGSSRLTRKQCGKKNKGIFGQGLNDKKYRGKKGIKELRGANEMAMMTAGNVVGGGRRVHDGDRIEEDAVHSGVGVGQGDAKRVESLDLGRRDDEVFDLVVRGLGGEARFGIGVEDGNGKKVIIVDLGSDDKHEMSDHEAAQTLMGLATVTD
ncbi:hypothetical protein K490DRAFT_63467 [Saccharata proteae CBS 121410]|uniref:Uncharacterized protein n=1 Tax=Saccharata proteae CBS 121410 TaxID=1314787 RepID=A0A6A5YED2_9PEZI|nr:hypothetical protein K490DRAFT_63467 [Saccharata proteae CBS 121410]